MNVITRICFLAHGAEITKTKRGSYVVSGFVNVQLQAARVILDLFSVLNFTLINEGNGRSGCINSLQENNSDFTYGLFPLTDLNQPYWVPAIHSPSSVLILTGYEVSSYIQSQKNKYKSKYSLINNIFLFDVQIYVAIALLFATFMSSYALCLKFKCKRKRSLRSFVTKFVKNLRVHIQRCWTISRTRLRCISFLMFITFFFIKAPFFLLFNTSQVVTDKPFLISNFETVLDFKVPCWKGIENLDRFLEPNGPSGIADRFWRHFQRTKNSPFSQRRGISESLAIMDEMMRKIIARKLVYLAQDHENKIMETLFCTLSSESEFFRTFYFKDKHSREIAVGSALRVGFTNGMLIKRLKWTFESQTTLPLSIIQPNYEYTLLTHQR